ncbi:hypothetical protein [Streptomyces jumonjinensis]|uniref:hypothetical protein n=1 Tax=Streptomyces jumonjinensis TaxID=1945 RepID=UPI00379378D3
MQVWATTDSNILFVHAFTGPTGEELRAMCRRTIRPNVSIRRGERSLRTEEEALRAPLTSSCERCRVKVAALAAETAAETPAEPAGPRSRDAAELAEVIAAGEAPARFLTVMESMTRTNNTTALSELARQAAALWPHAGDSHNGAPAEFYFLMKRAAGITHLATLTGIARRAAHLWDNTEDAVEVEGRLFLVTPENRSMFADITPAVRPVVGDVVAAIRADAVRHGDTVLGYALDETMPAERVTLRDVTTNAAPYTAMPRTYDRTCGCLGCEQVTTTAGPMVTLATDAHTPWETCDPVPAASLVLVHAGRRAEAAAKAAPFQPGDRVVCGDGQERGVTGMTFRPGEPDRVTVEGGAGWIAADCRKVQPPIRVRAWFSRAVLDGIKEDAARKRAAHRAEFDARKAAERARYGGAEETVERPAVEGAVVAHGGRSAGTAPQHAADADARAAVAALGELELAEVTDETDISAWRGDAGHDPEARGFLVEPRGGGRVAVYWVQGGQHVRPGGEPWARRLRDASEQLSAAGWKVEPTSVRCVFAWRPDAG